MAATIRDLAALAGVSPSTISRAFSRPEKVDETTRDRILTLAEQIGYVPSRAARTLKTGRTGALGIVVPDLSNPFFSDIVRGVQHRARDVGYSVLLADSDEDPTTEVELVTTLARNVDALVLCSPRMSDADLAAAARLQPMVLVNRGSGADAPGAVPPVTFDNAGGVRQAVEHLHGLGHRDIGFVSATGSSRSNADRRQAFHVATCEHGLSGVEIGTFAPTVDGGASAADATIRSGVSAVLVSNDVMAVGLLARLVRQGVDVPGEISVVGFDDIVMAGLITPALTSVAIPLRHAGAVAVDRLHAHLSGETPQGPPLDIPTSLVVRESTGPRPHAGGRSRVGPAQSADGGLGEHPGEGGACTLGSERLDHLCGASDQHVSLDRV
jgi:DNA-binding LacI/PurR family transcriptional regulator